MDKILVCNQKMFLTYDDAIKVKDELDKLNNNDIIIAPSYINLSVFKDYKLCAQDAFYDDLGAYTGKISAYQLAKLNVKYCLVGHSDLRDTDDDKTINMKIKSLLKNNIIPILCIGETKEEKELGKTIVILKRQIKYALRNIDINDKLIYIAYEPRFLIGCNKTLNINEIEEIFNYIKKVLSLYNVNNYKLLYGASVNKNNIDNIISNNIDGYLLGNASIDISDIKYILNCIDKCKEK